MTTLAFLGEFGDAFDYIFNSRESAAGGARVGGSELLPLLWTHLGVTAAAMAIATLGLASPGWTCMRTFAPGRNLPPRNVVSCP